MVLPRAVFVVGAAVGMLASVWTILPVAAGGNPGQNLAGTGKGKVIFEKTAGGVGCAFCHGPDGKGKSEFAAPDIQGKTASDILSALQTRPQMRFINLSDDEVRAVAEYLKALNGQP